MAINIGQGKYPLLNKQQASPFAAQLADILSRQTKRENLEQQRQRTPYIGQEEQAKLLASQLANQGAQARLPYAGPMAEAQLKRQQILNQYLPGREQSFAARNNAFAQRQAQLGQRGVFGGFGGVKGQYMSNFLQQFAQDNPNLSDDEKKEGIDQALKGFSQLSNGKPINLSEIAKYYLNNIKLAETTAPMFTQSARSNQGEAGLEVLSNMAQSDLAPYGDTLLGKSPEQIRDSFSKNTEDQKRLGRLFAARAAEYEKALLRTKIAQGTPALKAVHELMEASNQVIDIVAPKMSSTARKATNDRLNEYFKELLKAENAVGITPYSVNQYKQSLTNGKNNSSQVNGKVTDLKFVNGELVEG